MSDQDKIQAILNALNSDTLTSNTEKVMQSALLQSVPTLSSDQLETLMQALGLSES